MANDKMPFSRALLWILLSTLLVTGSAFMGWLYFQHMRERRFNDDQYRIVAIIQNTPQVDQLKTVYLAERLNLSFDQPLNLYQFKTKEAVQALLNDPLIKSASIKKIVPGTLYIQYEMRTPVAYIGDFTNTMIDEEGYLFPFRPFFTPKRLPTLYLGLEKENCKWGSCLKENSSFQLAFTLLQLFNRLHQEKFHIKQLDVLQVQEDSYGQRQIVMTLERQESMALPQAPFYLRLSPDHYAQDLCNFSTLQDAIFEKQELAFKKLRERSQEAMVIDLRIPHLAFIK